MTKELKTGIRGLSIVCSDDGVWLCTKSDIGKSFMLNLSNSAKESGGICGSALLEWCAQTAKESGWSPEIPPPESLRDQGKLIAPRVPSISPTELFRLQRERQAEDAAGCGV